MIGAPLSPFSLTLTASASASISLRLKRLAGVVHTGVHVCRVPRGGGRNGGELEGDSDRLGAARNRAHRFRVVCADGALLARHQVRNAADRQRRGSFETGEINKSRGC